MKSEIVALSDNTLLTQEEYLRREFRISLKYGVLPPQGKIYREPEIPLIVVSSNPAIWVKFLLRQEPLSTVFFLLGNETYDRKIFESLNGIPALRHVFVYNPPKSAALPNFVKMLFGNVLDRDRIGAILSNEVLKDARSSFKLWVRSRRIRLSYPWSEFPEGYSNSFVHGLMAIFEDHGWDFSKHDSLYSPKSQLEIARLTSKRKLFSFVGQTGRKRRHVSTDVVAKYFPSEIKYKKGFGGTVFDGDLSYVQSILESSFPMIPPGQCNNSNHRYSEILLTNGLPAILAQNSTDPMRSHNWTNVLNFPASHSFKFLARKLFELSEAEVERIRVRAKVEDETRTALARAQFQSILGK